MKFISRRELTCALVLSLASQSTVCAAESQAGAVHAIQLKPYHIALTPSEVQDSGIEEVNKLFEKTLTSFDVAEGMGAYVLYWGSHLGYIAWSAHLLFSGDASKIHTLINLILTINLGNRVITDPFLESTMTGKKFKHWFETRFSQITRKEREEYLAKLYKTRAMIADHADQACRGLGANGAFFTSSGPWVSDSIHFSSTGPLISTHRFTEEEFSAGEVFLNGKALTFQEGLAYNLVDNPDTYIFSPVKGNPVICQSGWTPVSSAVYLVEPDVAYNELGSVQVD